MTALLNALTSTAFSFRTQARKTHDVSEIEYQSIFAATAVLLAGGAAVCLVAFAQAF